MILSVETSLRPPHGVVAPSGELDLHSCTRLMERLDDALACGCTDLLLDASAIEFVDACALASLESFRRTCLARGGRLKVISASGPFTRMCRLGGYVDLVGSGSVEALVRSHPEGCDSFGRPGKPVPSSPRTAGSL